jgi:serine/threonine protein kinase
MCQHPSIIQQLNVVEDSEHYFIVLEYMKGADLFDYLQARDFNLGEDRVREICLQLVKGI